VKALIEHVEKRTKPVTDIPAVQKYEKKAGESESGHSEGEEGQS
jgi:hypothetical protein